MDKPLSMWIIFAVIVITLLVLDLGVFHRKSHAIGVRESLLLSLFYVVISLLFSIWIYYSLGLTRTTEYLTGYIIEKTLSLDNIFVISIVFAYLRIPLKYQHRVLFWGILGVIILRGIMIAVGVKLVEEFSWILYIFGAFLIFTGIKMMFVSVQEKENLDDNFIFNFIRKHLRVTRDLHKDHFFIIEKGQIFFTPLFAALVTIETFDIIFAIDSVPAIFAVTEDPYIIYTSNIFAILGLRALYFAVAAILYKFEYLKYSLAIILIFIGTKIFISEFFGKHVIPASYSLVITVLLLAAGVIFSLYMTNKNNHKHKYKKIDN